MLPIRCVAFAVILLIACVPCAFAQEAIEKQMTADEFRAAGLGKLTPDELARLNAWLNRTITTETAKAATEARKKVEDDNRGFFNFGSTEPVAGRMVGEFRGFARGGEYTLENGHVWKQIDDTSLVGVRKSNPTVRITPSMVGNAWYMAIEGYNTRAKVQRVK